MIGAEAVAVGTLVWTIAGAVSLAVVLEACACDLPAEVWCVVASGALAVAVALGAAAATEAGAVALAVEAASGVAGGAD